MPPLDWIGIVTLFGIAVSINWWVVKSYSDRMERRFDQQDARFDKRFDQQDAGFDKRFDQQDARFDKRFDQQDARFDKRFDQQDAGFDQRLDGHDGRFDRQERRLERLETLMLRLVRDVGLLMGAMGIYPAAKAKAGSGE